MVLEKHNNNNNNNNNNNKNTKNTKTHKTHKTHKTQKHNNLETKNQRYDQDPGLVNSVKNNRHLSTFQSVSFE